MGDDARAVLGIPPEEVDPGPEAADGEEYERPVVIDVGAVRAMTLGSSSGRRADAHSQWYN